MLTVLLFLLILFWLLGYATIPFIILPNITLAIINGQTITLWDLLTLLVISWIIGILPRPFREIGGVIFILWILSKLGILAFAGLSNILLIIIIVGLVIYLISGV